MKNIFCPICNSPDYSVIYKNVNIFSIVQCKLCHHNYTLIDKELNIDILYNEGDYQAFDSRETLIEKIIDFENNRILKKIEKYALEKQILDFGSGKGKFLKVAKLKNWETFGVETSPYRAEYAIKNYNLKISREFYEKGKISDTSFGVITLFHVLEHIYNSKILLKNLIEDNLKESGIFLIEVPNFDSFQSKIAGSKWLHLDVPRHINHFKFDILKKMIEDIGGRIINVEYYHTVHGILGMVSSLLNLLGYHKNIMSELKYRRTLPLIFMIIVTLPIATLFEIIATLLKKGAVLRIYATINK